MERADLERQIPGAVLESSPRSAGADSTLGGLLYHRVLSRSDSTEDDWSEDLLVVPQDAAEAALRRVQERQRLGRDTGAR